MSFVGFVRVKGWGALAALAAFTLPAAALALEVDPGIAAVCNLPGKTIAEAKSDKADGSLQLQGYRVEELRFAPMKVKVRGKDLQTNTAWRITVYGGPFAVRDIPAVIWVDKEPVGWGQESPELRSVSTIVFDASLIRNDAELFVSYGENGDRIAVPARIALSSLQGKGEK